MAGLMWQRAHMLLCACMYWRPHSREQKRKPGVRGRDSHTTHWKRESALMLIGW